jgi:hypothetical protein
VEACHYDTGREEIRGWVGVKSFMGSIHLNIFNTKNLGGVTQEKYTLVKHKNFKKEAHFL